MWYVFLGMVLFSVPSEVILKYREECIEIHERAISLSCCNAYKASPTCAVRSRLRLCGLVMRANSLIANVPASYCCVIAISMNVLLLFPSRRYPPRQVVILMQHDVNKPHAVSVQVVFRLRRFLLLFYSVIVRVTHEFLFHFFDYEVMFEPDRTKVPYHFSSWKLWAVIAGFRVWTLRAAIAFFYPLFGWKRSFEPICKNQLFKLSWSELLQNLSYLRLYFLALRTLRLHPSSPLRHPATFAASPLSLSVS